MDGTYPPCQSCHSSHYIVDGVHLVCTSCGTINEKGSIEESKSFIDQDTEGRAMIYDDLRSFRSAYLGNKHGRNMPITDYKQLYRNKIHLATKRLCRLLNLSSDIHLEAGVMIADYLQKKLPNPGSHRLIPAFVYLAARRREIPLCLVEVADAWETSPHRIARTFRTVIDRLCCDYPKDSDPSILSDKYICMLIPDAIEDSSEDVSSQLKQEIQQNDEFEADEFFNDFLLGLSTSNQLDESKSMQKDVGFIRQKAITTTHRLIKLAADHQLTIGRYPAPLAAAATYLVLSSFPDTKTFSSKAQVVEVSNCTLRTFKVRLKELKTLILSVAQKSLPWAETIKKSNLEEYIPILLNQLETEAKIAAMKLRKEAATKPEEETHFLSPMSLVSSSNLTESTKSQSRLSLPTQLSASDQLSIKPQIGVAEISSTTIPKIGTDDDQANSKIEISTNNVEISQGEDEESERNPKKRRNPIKLEISSVKAFKHLKDKAPPSLGPHILSSCLDDASHLQGDETPQLNQISASSSSLFSPKPTARLSSRISSSLLIKPDPIPFLPSSGPSESVFHTIPDRSLSSAPAFVANSIAYSKRSKQIHRAKLRLSQLAKSLSAEDAAKFGVLKFKDYEERLSQYHPKSNESPKSNGFSFSTIDTLDRSDAEGKDIEALLIAGIPEEQLLIGHVAALVEAQKSHLYELNAGVLFNASDALRTSLEVANIQSLQAAYKRAGLDYDFD